MGIKDIGLIALIGIVVWLFIANGVKDKKIMDLQINSAYYKEQNRKLDLKRDSINMEIFKSKLVIDSLNNILSKIPTDEKIRENTIPYVDINDSWLEIILPIESAIDGSEG